MKRVFLLLIIICACASLYAQWTSEGTGRTYTLQQLAEIPEAGVIFTYGECEPDFYLLTKSLNIIGDTLLFDFDARVADSVSIEVENGGFYCEDHFISNEDDSMASSYAIRLTDNTRVHIKYSKIEHCGGISLVDVHADMENVIFHSFNTKYYSSAISMMNSTANINNCEFSFNMGSAISSAANGNSTIKMEDCYVWANVFENSNRPQINLGPGTADTIFITNCIIKGYEGLNNVGGISIANLTGNAQTTNVVIDSCEISGNRYGINLYGYNINALVTNNKIKNNNLETNPMNGGSGISIYGVDENCKAKLRNNTISGNLWGITSINKNSIDLGTADDWGGNYIYDNGNGGITYALYNNASTDIYAIGNFWGTNDISEAEDVIFHRPDLGENYGLVIYEPITLPHPQLISLSCIREDNCLDEPIPDCKEENCDKNKSCFLGEDLIGFVNEYQHTIYLYYYGVLSDHEEFHNLILRYELGELCNGLPESGTSFQFDDLYQSQLIVSTPFGESETWTIQLMETESITEQETEKLTVVPTPAHDKVWIGMDANSHFTVTDLTGRKVFGGKSNSDKTELDIQNWESGIYIINTIKNGRQKAARIVVY